MLLEGLLYQPGNSFIGVGACEKSQSGPALEGSVCTGVHVVLLNWFVRSHAPIFQEAQLVEGMPTIHKPHVH